MQLEFENKCYEVVVSPRMVPPHVHFNGDHPTLLQQLLKKKVKNRPSRAALSFFSPKIDGAIRPVIKRQVQTLLSRSHILP